MSTPNFLKFFAASGAVIFNSASVSRVEASAAPGASLRTICIIAANEIAPCLPVIPSEVAADAIVGMN